MTAPVFIEAYGLVSALGVDAADTARALFAPIPRKIDGDAVLIGGRTVPVGRCADVAAGQAETRSNRLVAHAFAAIAGAVADARERHGASRIGVIIGTSTSGIGEGGDAVKALHATGSLPANFSLDRQTLGDTATFAAALAGAEGPVYTISTACTSGARAVATGARLIEAGVCDVVVAGGADALCDLTLNGFAALDSLSGLVCNPMSANRDGLNIGEGAALFLLSRRESRFRVAGWGGSADGHHLSAPDPSGRGAEAAIGKALRRGGIEADAIDFVHLHGTATRLNDAMEADVALRLFGDDTPCASTKPLTGHTLGAAGAIQAALCLLAMEHGRLPPHVYDGVRDPDLAPIRLAASGEGAALRTILSASYAFGGNNAALVLAGA